MFALSEIRTNDSGDQLNEVAEATVQTTHSPCFTVNPLFNVTGKHGSLVEFTCTRIHGHVAPRSETMHNPDYVPNLY